jgi:hypothetical protein
MFPPFFLFIFAVRAGIVPGIFVKVWAGVFCVSPALWAGLSNTSQEINFNYREATPCRRRASLNLAGLAAEFRPYLILPEVI